MRLLVVAMAESVHTARWLGQLRDTGWDIHLFPSLDSGGVHPALAGVTVHHSAYSGVQTNGANVRTRGVRLPHRYLATLGRVAINKVQSDFRVGQLARLIGRLRPDLVHSLAIQAAGYLTLAAPARVRGCFP